MIAQGVLVSGARIVLTGCFRRDRAMTWPAVTFAMAKYGDVSGIILMLEGRSGIRAWQIQESTNEAGSWQLRDSMQSDFGPAKITPNRFGDRHLLRNKSADRRFQTHRDHERTLQV